MMSKVSTRMPDGASPACFLSFVSSEESNPRNPATRLASRPPALTNWVAKSWDPNTRINRLRRPVRRGTAVSAKRWKELSFVPPKKKEKSECCLEYTDFTVHKETPCQQIDTQRELPKFTIQEVHASNHVLDQFLYTKT